MRFTPKDNTENVEILIHSKFGAEVTVIYKNELNKGQQQFNNVTEVHWLFNIASESSNLVSIDSTIKAYNMQIQVSNIEALIIENQTEIDPQPYYTW